MPFSHFVHTGIDFPAGLTDGRASLPRYRIEPKAFPAHRKPDGRRSGEITRVRWSLVLIEKHNMVARFVCFLFSLEIPCHVNYGWINRNWPALSEVFQFSFSAWRAICVVRQVCWNGVRLGTYQNSVIAKRWWSNVFWSIDPFTACVRAFVIVGWSWSGGLVGLGGTVVSFTQRPTYVLRLRLLSTLGLRVFKGKFRPMYEV